MTFSYAERCWRDLAKGRWEAKHHVIRDAAEMRLALPGEEIESPAPKSGKDNKRKRLGEEEDEDEDEGNDSALVVRARIPTEVAKPSKSKKVFETLSHDEASSKKDSGKAPKSPEVEIIPRAFTKFRANLIQYEAELQKTSEERNALKLFCGQKEEELRDLQADLAQARKEEAELDEQVTIILKEYGLDPTVEVNTSVSQLQQKLERIELLRWEVDQIKADCDRWKENMDHLAPEKEAASDKLLSAEIQLRVAKEKNSARAKRIKEHAVELAKSNDLAKCQSRRETLEEIHARVFDLSKELAHAKVLEADARFLVSSDDEDDDEGSQGGSDNDKGPEGEATP
ncbi:uncharacterized protein [Nicotiana sylvestris]|uniref:uncharacterized protein n=1 Tax=Nicotiana sylvestris TaxID=4096 RepID=UPI00388C35FA